MAFLLCMALMCPAMMFLMYRAMKKPEAEPSDIQRPVEREAELARLRSQLAELRDAEEAPTVPRADV